MVPIYKELIHAKKSIEKSHNVEITLGDLSIIRKLFEKEIEFYKDEYDSLKIYNLVYWATREYIKQYLSEDPKF